MNDVEDELWRNIVYRVTQLLFHDDCTNTQKQKMIELALMQLGMKSDLESAMSILKQPPMIPF